MKWNWKQWLILGFALLIGGFFTFSNYLKMFVYPIHPPFLIAPMTITLIASTMLIYIILVFAWSIDGYRLWVKRID